MKRLILTGLAVGVIGAAVVAWEAREGVAYAVEQPASDPQDALLRAITAGCVDSLGIFKAELQGGVVVANCRPGLGVAPVRRPTQRRQVAIRSPQGREAEDLVGPHTPTNRNRPGAPNGSPGRAGAGVEGDQP